MLLLQTLHICSETIMYFFDYSMQNVYLFIIYLTHFFRSKTSCSESSPHLNLSCVCYWIQTFTMAYQKMNYRDLFAILPSLAILKLSFKSSSQCIYFFWLLFSSSLSSKITCLPTLWGDLTWKWYSCVYSLLVLFLICTNEILLISA